MKANSEVTFCVTVEKAAELAHVSKEEICNWAEYEPDFPSFKVGKLKSKRLIHVEAFKDWLRKRAENRIGERL